MTDNTNKIMIGEANYSQSKFKKRDVREIKELLGKTLTKLLANGDLQFETVQDIAQKTLKLFPNDGLDSMQLENSIKSLIQEYPVLKQALNKI